MSSAHITFDTTGDKIARRVRKMRPSAVRNLFAAATRDDVISLSGGMPAVSLLPEEDIRRATLAAIESPEARAVSLQYGPTDGLAGLRAVLADMMRDLGIRVKADQVLVTTGAQQALTLIAEAFIDPLPRAPPIWGRCRPSPPSSPMCARSPSTRTACAWISWKRNSSASARTTRA